MRLGGAPQVASRPGLDSVAHGRRRPRGPHDRAGPASDQLHRRRGPDPRAAASPRPPHTPQSVSGREPNTVMPLIADRKTIVGKLTNTAEGAESAVGRVANARRATDHRRAPPRALRGGGRDAARILHQFEMDRLRLVARLQKTVNRMRTGNAGRPPSPRASSSSSEESWTPRVALHRRDAAAHRRDPLAVHQQPVEVRDGLDPRARADPERPAEEVPRHRRAVEGVGGGRGGGDRRLAGRRLGRAGRRRGGSGGGRTSAVASPRTSPRRSATARSTRSSAATPRSASSSTSSRAAARTTRSSSATRAPARAPSPRASRSRSSPATSRPPQERRAPQPRHRRLQAGAGGRVRNRLKNVISEVKGRQAHRALHRRGAHHHRRRRRRAAPDAANLLKPALARGELRTIAATTWAEYKKYFEKDAALAGASSPCPSTSPRRTTRSSCSAASAGVREGPQRGGARRRHRRRGQALNRYISGRLLPDKAVDLIDTATARVKINLDAKPDSLVDLEVQHDGASRERDALDRDKGVELPRRPGALRQAGREDRGRSRRRSTNSPGAGRRRDAVRVVRDARKKVQELKGHPADRARSRPRGAHHGPRGVREGQGQTRAVSADVDPDAVARVVGELDGHPRRQDAEGRRRQPALARGQAPRARVRGQDHAMRAVAEVIRASQAGCRTPTSRWACCSSSAPRASARRRRPWPSPTRCTAASAS